MLKSLTLENVGPAHHMALDFAPRLNLLTGDNGLGKSFVLDLAWWSLTRTWAGQPARPRVPKQPATISYAFDGKTAEMDSRGRWRADRQEWERSESGRPPKPGLVLYAQVDGGFSVWDPARNYWRKEPGRPDAYLLAPNDVWNGLENNGRPICNGLIRDWALWQRGDSENFALLTAAMKALSPSHGERFVPGKLTRISLDDVRDMPTITMPYGQDVPIVHASAGIRRVAALAYLLVWAWTEHARASELLEHKTTNQVIFLIDEVEAHLHPKWQRTILKALLAVVKKTLHPKRPQIQIIAATHSPLILSSVETLFNAEEDAWLDFDLTKKGVTVEARTFTRHGDASAWLTSEAFDLGSAYSVDAEAVLAEADALLQGKPNKQRYLEVDAKLRSVLGEFDPFWISWRYLGEKKKFLADGDA